MLYCHLKWTWRKSNVLQIPNLKVGKLQKLSRSSMIKRVLGQPNFSPQTNTTQLFPQINTNFNNLSSVKVNTNI